MRRLMRRVHEREEESGWAQLFKVAELFQIQLEWNGDRETGKHNGLSDHEHEFGDIMNTWK